MAYLKQRGKTWYIKYRGEDGELVTKALHTDSKQIAELKLKEFERVGKEVIFGVSRLPGAAGDAIATKTPLGAALDAFAKHVRTHKGSTNAVKYLSVLRSIFGEICPELKYKINSRKKACTDGRPLLQCKNLEDLTTAMVQDYLDSVLLVKDNKGKVTRGYICKRTRNRYREALHYFYEWAMTDGRYSIPAGNPVTKIKYLRVDNMEVRYLSAEAIEIQLDCLEGHPMLQTMVAVYIRGGLRREEALWLTHDDIDLERGVIIVHEKTIGGIHWKPKNGKDRTVEINSRLRGYLERYRPEPTEHNWFFPNPAGNRWNPDVFSACLRKLNLEMLQLPVLADFPMLKMAVELFVYSSLKWSHIVALTNGDIDLEQGFIRVRKKRNWRIKINEKLRECIVAYKAAGGNDAPFIQDLVGNSWDEERLNKALTDVFRKKGVDWSCDEYRHTYGTNLIQNNVSTFKVAKLMGNSEDIVKKHYVADLPIDSRDNLDF